MERLTRRGFVRAAGVAVMAAGKLQAFQAATVAADLAAPAVRFNRMLFGQFLEHFHRQVYGGVFEPGSPLSDGDGFRTDVIAALRELKIPVVRWPGGCFASAYHWLDGVGQPRRPSFDKAWGVEDSNAFGTGEFVKWCRAIGAEPYNDVVRPGRVVPENREWKLQDGALRLPPHSVSIVQGQV